MIYYVEDDNDIRNLVVYTLTRSDIETRGFENVTSFIAELQNSELPDLIILDIMLPDNDGITLLKRIRSGEFGKGCSTIPVIMLTAKTDEFDTISALDLGADDYIKKPFSMMELLSRIRAVLRRNTNIKNADNKGSQNDILSFDKIQIDIPRHLVFVTGEHNTELDLTLKEFDLLKFLAENPDITFERSRLLETVWGYEYVGETRTVDVHIRTLRKKLDDAQLGLGMLIETVHGVGYKFVGDN